jgi:hypothetical protein
MKKEVLSSHQHLLRIRFEPTAAQVMRLQVVLQDLLHNQGDTI